MRNKEKAKAYKKAYREANKEKAKAYKKAYCEANKEKIKAHRKAYREANNEKVKARNKDYREANPEKIKAYCRVQSQRRRALKNNVFHEDYIPAEIYRRDGWVCQLCFKKIKKRLKWPDPQSASIDHITPISKGGADAPVNLQAAHLGCNMSKGNKLIGQPRLFG